MSIPEELIVSSKYDALRAAARHLLHDLNLEATDFPVEQVAMYLEQWHHWGGQDMQKKVVAMVETSLSRDPTLSKVIDGIKDLD